MNIDSNIRPNVVKDGHPVETQEYTFETPVIKSISDEVVRWVHNRIPGGLVYGWPRHGKSRFITLLAKKLKENFPDTPVLTISSDWTSAPSEKDFFRMLLEEVGLDADDLKLKTVAQRLGLFTNYLAAHSHRNGKILLIVDEGQNLVYAHYEALISIHNRLARTGVALIVILVGQSELVGIRNAFSVDRPQIFGRFMIEEVQFHGIRYESEIKFVLRCYDEHSEYPPGSGWSFTRFFLPQWYSKGGRLAAYSEDLWRLVGATRGTDGPPNLKEFPMNYMMLTIENFFRLTSDRTPLRDTMPLETPAHSLSALAKALENSGYVKACGEGAGPSLAQSLRYPRAEANSAQKKGRQ